MWKVTFSLYHPTLQRYPCLRYLTPPAVDSLCPRPIHQWTMLQRPSQLHPKGWRQSWRLCYWTQRQPFLGWTRCLLHLTDDDLHRPDLPVRRASGRAFGTFCFLILFLGPFLCHWLIRRLTMYPTPWKLFHPLAALMDCCQIEAVLPLPRWKCLSAGLENVVEV
mgnify:CR=1 FL=1